MIKVVKQEMNDGIARYLGGKIPTLALNKIDVIKCQCRDFLTELYCNNVIISLFTFGSLLHFKIKYSMICIWIYITEDYL